MYTQLRLKIVISWHLLLDSIQQVVRSDAKNIDLLDQWAPDSDTCMSAHLSADLVSQSDSRHVLDHAT